MPIYRLAETKSLHDEHISIYACVLRVLHLLSVLRMAYSHLRMTWLSNRNQWHIVMVVKICGRYTFHCGNAYLLHGYIFMPTFSHWEFMRNTHANSLRERKREKEGSSILIASAKSVSIWNGKAAYLFRMDSMPVNRWHCYWTKSEFHLFDAMEFGVSRSINFCCMTNRRKFIDAIKWKNENKCRKQTSASVSECDFNNKSSETKY